MTLNRSVARLPKPKVPVARLKLAPPCVVSPYSAVSSTPLNSWRRMKLTTPAIASEP
jgi:hypothetical protein